MDFLKQLEAESIYVLREVKAQFKNPVVLFSGGKDSLCLLHLSLKAFYPDPFPFQVLHIDTGHNFPETLEFRDKIIHKLGAKLIVRKVEDTIKAGRVQDDHGPYPSRNRQQAKTLMDAIAEFGFDAAIGGARRDEERSRAKERFFSARSKTGAWIPREQGPELWNLYCGKSGDQMRVFPLNNWTELDIWRYIKAENLEVPSLYFSHRRKCLKKADGSWLPDSPFLNPQAGDNISEQTIRFRTVGDMSCTSPFFSEAKTVDEIIEEITTSRLSERGSRADDKVSENAMEDRKKEGYF